MFRAKHRGRRRTTNGGRGAGVAAGGARQIKVSLMFRANRRSPNIKAGGQRTMLKKSLIVSRSTPRKVVATRAAMRKP